MNIDELEAGRELDALVAEKVMGWERKKNYHIPSIDRICLEAWVTPDGQWYPTEWSSVPPRYSTDIAAAWEVDKPGWLWDFIEQDNWLLTTIYHRDNKEPIGSACIEWNRDTVKTQAYALSRCRAALKAVGGLE